MRELQEETGIEVENYRLVGTVLVDASDEVGVCVFVLRGEYSNGQLIQSVEGALEWHEVDQLNTLPCVADVPVLVQRVASMRVGDMPFSARSFYDEQEKLTVRFHGGDAREF
jgi:8-oxo-dGTP diphosphatase